MRPLATYIDHTQLKAFCTENDIVNLCAEARQYQFAAVCVPPCYVGTAKEQLKDSEVKCALLPVSRWAITLHRLNWQSVIIYWKTEPMK